MLYRFLPDWELDACLPVAELIQGTDGNFYGTSMYGGDYGGGTVFKVTPAGVVTVLYSFTGGADGNYPLTALVQGSDGNFYGTTSEGGIAFGWQSWGTVFKITPAGVLTTLYAFNGYPSDGGYPVSALIQGTDGNFYGTTYQGGSYGPDFGGGTIYKVTPDGAESVLHEFGNGLDGLFPAANLLQGYDGNFYGTTSFGGAYGYGTVFKITPDAIETVLHSFMWSEGANPDAGLTLGYDGNFYGTTSWGGTYGYGTVFRLSGLYPLPLTGISPGTCNAGGPAFTLTAKGTGFQPFTIVCWNGSPLATTFVSSSVLKAAVPASLIATPGTARIMVVTGGGPSNAKKVTIKLTTLKLTSATLTKNSDGSYTANVSLQNTGYQSAANALFKKATLGTAATSTSLPHSLGTIAAGATGTASLTFPASAGTSGTAVHLTVSGAFTGGTFSGTLNVKLP